MTEAPNEHGPEARTAWIQLLILLGLCVVAFWPELSGMIRAILRDIEAAHALAAPVLVLIMFCGRRHALAMTLSKGKGSVWGMVALVAALGIYAMANWPFDYETVQRVMMVLAMASVVLAVGGWRVLKLAGPMLLILLIAIPFGARYYAFVIIKPETITLDAVSAALNLLPGVTVTLQGSDLLYYADGGTGSIALGEPHRGASLLLSYLTIGVFVTFVRIRPLWQVVVMMVAAAPVVLICNFARVMCWGVLTIYAGSHPLSPVPRIVSIIFSLVLAYGLSTLLLGIMSRLVTDAEASDSAHAPQVLGAE